MEPADGSSEEEWGVVWRIRDVERERMRGGGGNGPCIYPHRPPLPGMPRSCTDMKTKEHSSYAGGFSTLLRCNKLYVHWPCKYWRGSVKTYCFLWIDWILLIILYRISYLLDGVDGWGQIQACFIAHLYTGKISWKHHICRKSYSSVFSLLVSVPWPR